MSKRTMGGEGSREVLALLRNASLPWGCLSSLLPSPELPQRDQPLQTPKFLCRVNQAAWLSNTFLKKGLSVEDTSGNRFTVSNGSRDRNHNSKHK